MRRGTLEKQGRRQGGKSRWGLGRTKDLMDLYHQALERLFKSSSVFFPPRLTFKHFTRINEKEIELAFKMIVDLRFRGRSVMLG